MAKVTVYILLQGPAPRKVQYIVDGQTHTRIEIPASPEFCGVFGSEKDAKNWASYCARDLEWEPRDHSFYAVDDERISQWFIKVYEIDVDDDNPDKERE